MQSTSAAVVLSTPMFSFSLQVLHNLKVRFNWQNNLSALRCSLEVLFFSKGDKHALGAKRNFPFILVFIGSSLCWENVRICLENCRFCLVHNLLLWVSLSKLSSAPGSAVVSWLTFSTHFPSVSQFGKVKSAKWFLNALKSAQILWNHLIIKEQWEADVWGFKQP